jgi:hypothetical protein
LIAFGGIQGEIGILDSDTLLPKGFHKAHNSEISNLYFYDKQSLLLSVGLDGDIAIWDAQKM